MTKLWDTLWKVNSQPNKYDHIRHTSEKKSTGVEPEGIENLALLSLGLHRLADVRKDLGFDMATYTGATLGPTDAADEQAVLLYTLTADAADCRTSACAVGHGPLFGLRVGGAPITWSAYSHTVFAIRTQQHCGWHWMFAGTWRRTQFGQETREAAAKRIAWYIRERQTRPGNWCSSPLSFHTWGPREEYEAWQPDWAEIASMISVEKLRGIEWIDELTGDPG